jgi:hypothetical protein
VFSQEVGCLHHAIERRRRPLLRDIDRECRADVDAQAGAKPATFTMT